MKINIIYIKNLIFLYFLFFISSCSFIHNIEERFAVRTVTVDDVYYPGFYQTALWMPGYDREGYYDYLGNYQARYQAPDYIQEPRWVHGFIAEQVITIRNY